MRQGQESVKQAVMKVKEKEKDVLFGLEELLRNKGQSLPDRDAVSILNDLIQALDVEVRNELKFHIAGIRNTNILTLEQKCNTLNKHIAKSLKNLACMEFVIEKLILFMGEKEPLCLYTILKDNFPKHTYYVSSNQEIREYLNTLNFNTFYQYDIVYQISQEKMGKEAICKLYALIQEQEANTNLKNQLSTQIEWFENISNHWDEIQLQLQESLISKETGKATAQFLQYIFSLICHGNTEVYYISLAEFFRQLYQREDMQVYFKEWICIYYFNLIPNVRDWIFGKQELSTKERILNLSKEKRNNIKQKEDILVSQQKAIFIEAYFKEKKYEKYKIETVSLIGTIIYQIVNKYWNSFRFQDCESVDSLENQVKKAFVETIQQINTTLEESVPTQSIMSMLIQLQNSYQLELGNYFELCNILNEKEEKICFHEQDIFKILIAEFSIGNELEEGKHLSLAELYIKTVLEKLYTV